MAGICDYLLWRGDLSFDERRFNDVDNVVLSILAYLDFTGIVPGEFKDGTVSLEDACSELLQKANGDIEPYIRSFASIDSSFVSLLAKSRRFGNAQLHSYIDIVDDAVPLQFAALTIELPHECAYVAFRGTDNTLAGWRENFMLSFTVTEAQRQANQYLGRMLAHADRHGLSVRVGGHSKGANLAEYAATHCSHQLQSHIVRVYSNDGPGMEPEVAAAEGAYHHPAELIKRIVPAYSVVGMLFARDEESRTIVQSSAKGIEQHDPTTWLTTYNGLQEAPELIPECVLLNKDIARWTGMVSLKNRETVVNDIFDALETDGNTTLDDIMSSPERLQHVLAALGKADEITREVAQSLVQCVVDSSIENVRKAALKSLQRLRPPSSRHKTKPAL